MPVKVTLVLTAGRQAWSESHYWLNGDDPQVPVNPAINLARLRALCLAQDGACAAVRLSDLVHPGHAELVNIEPPWTGQSFRLGFLGGGPLTVDTTGVSNETLVIDAAGTANGAIFKTRPSLGGLPNQLVKSKNGIAYVDFANTPKFQQALNNLALELTGQQRWGFKARLQGTQYPILSLTGGDGGPIVLVVSGAFAADLQSIVHVRGFRVHPTTRVALAGLWRVQALAANTPVAGQTTVTLSGSEHVGPASAYKLPGSIQTVASQYIPYDRFVPDKPASRKRGGSIELPRGRSRTRA